MDEIHLTYLEVFRRLCTHKFRRRQSKCPLFQLSVKLWDTQLMSSPAKCQAIMKNDARTDVAELCYFLGIE